ncbi:MAG: DegT/DnrJ/EryC1/StrS aminotransferase family protein [Deltaproteobacteria bacterium]|nr:DegT/DnrJ/EryC1/StrS aminotransferase family protein [Deltaproteobacteria bacterium]
MIKFLKKLAWYPPAESKIPLHTILGAFLHYSVNFEKILCNYLQVKHCVLGNSGRALLYILLDALKRKDDDLRNEVLIPGYTCYSVAASVAKAGLKIRVYDLDPATLQPDLSSLWKSASEKTLAIIFQHLFGIPTPVEELKGVARLHNAYLIEDAAQALGGSIDDHCLGTIGDFSIFSFGRGKPLPIGGGGALVGKDADVLSGLDLKPGNKGYASLMSTAVSQVMSKPSFYWIPEMLPLGLGETIFDPHFNVSAMQPAMQNLAENSMNILDDLNTHRGHIAKTYEEAFDDKCLIPVPEGGSVVYTRFPLMAGPCPIPKELKRLGVRRMYPKAIADEKTIKPYLADQEASTHGALEIARKLITLPTHKGITENLAKDIAHIVMRLKMIH